MMLIILKAVLLGMLFVSIVWLSWAIALVVPSVGGTQKYVYFCSYSHADAVSGTFGSGNAEVKRDRPITSIADIVLIAKQLREQLEKEGSPEEGIVILNFTLLRTEK